ncbi:MULTISPECIES: hypothetical protein [unclassified Frankia]|uniref:hypothetical protein n=1 Tax=unclassified Frankia TaxID=2632575 RepID=UPI001EF3F140|nr:MULTISPECIES: hypothetical protein [unclassified Frankia]
MLIDCGTCAVRGDACGDCALHVLLGSDPAAGWDETELRALALLADAGLLARMTPWPRPVPLTPPPAGPARLSPAQRSHGRARRAG